MRQFGPLRNLWEGSYQGEGYLRIAKKHMKTGLRGNWEYNTMKKVLQEKTFFHLLEKYENEYIKEDKCNNQEMFYSYKNRMDAFFNYEKGVPLSIVQLQNGSFGFLFGNGDIFLPLTRHAYVCDVNGASYHIWKFAEENIETMIMHQINILNYCLLLPRYLITKDEKHKAQYNLITHNWTEMLEDGTISLPVLPSL